MASKTTITAVCLVLLASGCPPPKERPKDGRAVVDRGANTDKPFDINKIDDIGATPDQPIKDLPGSAEQRPVGDTGPLCDSGKRLDADLACAGGCFIDQQCFKAGAVASSIPDKCGVCDPAFSRYFWAPAKGCVITLAGSGTSGTTDGAALSASFVLPRGVTVDRFGTVYVADGGGQTVRMISRGRVSTVAGVKNSAGDGLGNALSAKFSTPVGLVVDRSGALIVSDKVNDVLKRVSCGMVDVFAGLRGRGGRHIDGPAATAQFLEPAGLAIDGSGAVVVADFENHVIRRVANGTVTTLAGQQPPVSKQVPGYIDGPFAAARFHQPEDVAVDAAGTTVYVADSENNVIRRITGGQVSTFVGQKPTDGGTNAGCVHGSLTNAKLNNPSSVALDRKTGDLYLVDNCNCVRVVRNGSKTVDALNYPSANGVCSYGKQDGELINAGMGRLEHVAVGPTGRVFVSDRGNYSIRVLNP